MANAAAQSQDAGVSGDQEVRSTLFFHYPSIFNNNLFEYLDEGDNGDENFVHGPPLDQSIESQLLSKLTMSSERTEQAYLYTTHDIYVLFKPKNNNRISLDVLISAHHIVFISE